MTTTLKGIETVAAPAVARPMEPVAEALRYLVASAGALALDASVLAVATTLWHMPAWLAGACGYLAGLVLIYSVSTRWVFVHRVVRDRRKEFSAFACIGVGGLVLNSVTLSAATMVGLSLPFAKAISAAVGFTANFVGRKVLLFTKSRATTEDR